MANIEIEPKRRSVWPWIIGLLVLALVAWLVLAPRDEGDVAVVSAPVATPADGAVEATQPAGAPMPVEDFLSWVGGTEARERMGRDHEYTADGIRRLAAALGAVVSQQRIADTAFDAALIGLRQRADALQRDATADMHALEAREAFLLAASTIEGVQQRRFPNLAAETTEAWRTARAVNAQRPLLEQQEQVREFFDRAAAALRRMTAAT